jgi:hypothetical protein
MKTGQDTGEIGITVDAFLILTYRKRTAGKV